MKLQTMLLPTGEFVFIASELEHMPPSLDGFEGFRVKSGAAAILIASDPVEIEDALVDADAVRADFWSEWDDDEDPDGGPDGDDGEREGLASVTYLPNASVTFTTKVNPEVTEVLFGARADWGQGGTQWLTTAEVADDPTGWEVLGETDTGDELLVRRLAEGADFSPAGLVKEAAPTPGVLEPELQDALRHNPTSAGTIGGTVRRTVDNVQYQGGDGLVLEDNILGPGFTRREPGYITAKDGFTLQPPTVDLLTLSRYFTTDSQGETEAQDALEKLANPEPREWWVGPACPCWPAGAGGVNGVARCGGCPEAKYDAPDPTAS